MSTTEAERQTSMFVVLRRTIPELFRAAPVGTTLLSLILLVQAFVPVLTLYLTRLTVDGVTARLRGGEGDIFLLAALWVLSLLMSAVLSPIQDMLQGNVGEKLTGYVNLRLIDRARDHAGLDLLEDPRFYDDLELLKNGANDRPLYTLILLFTTGRELLTLVGLAALLATVGWWVPFAALVGALPLAIVTFRAQKITFEALVRRTPEARAMAYESNLALGREAAAEVRLYDLLPWLRGRYQRAFNASHETMKRVRTQQALSVTPTSILSLVVTAGLFVWTIFRASDGQLSVGEIVVVVSGLTQFQSLLFSLVEGSSWLYNRVLYFDKYFAFLTTEPQIISPKDGVTLESGVPAVRFEDVTFRYPDGRTALRNVSFELRPGETLAVVGENGAGKTTLTKLLLRFYDVSEGSVSLGSHNIKDVDLTAWRKRVAAVFQDFGRYSYSVRENVMLADVDTQDDTRLQEALEKSGFSTTVDELPGGLEARLGKAFGGTELSGGQWQKLALARSLYRRADLLILDEPTAALDPRSEAQVYEQFAGLAAGRSALLITHRLGSVLSADRILVLKEGRLVEEGTHLELLAKGGEYADLWRLQATQYRDL